MQSHELLREVFQKCSVKQVAAELGLKPDMKGSVALFGVTFAVDVSKLKQRVQERRDEKRREATPRRRPKDEPPST